MKTYLAILFLPLGIVACSVPKYAFQPPAPNIPHASLRVEMLGVLDPPVVQIVNINGKPVNQEKEFWKLRAFSNFDIPAGDTLIETRSCGYIRFNAVAGKHYFLSANSTPNDVTLTISMGAAQRNVVVSRTFFKTDYLDFSDRKKGNLLVDAIAAGNVIAVKKLLAKGADPNWVDHYGLNPIPLAALEGNLEILQILVDAGGRLDTSEGANALVLAASHGNLDMVRYLVENGADINRRGCRQEIWPIVKDNSSLMEAAKNGHVQVVEYLLQHKAYTKFYNEDGKTALDLAREGGHSQIVSLLSHGSKTR